MLLDYFVTGRTRRELLRLLWAKEAAGSVSEFSRRAGVRYAAVHRELKAMRATGLAVCERTGRQIVYRANPRHPQAALVRELVRDRDPQMDERLPEAAEKVRAWLRASGAPLWAPLLRRAPPLEEVVAAGVALAHCDATVALVLPILLWRQRDRLDYDRLVREATRLDERQALGFFLELASRLGGDARLRRVARRLRDRRRRRVGLFFSLPHGRFRLALARKNTPRLARKWGFLMNETLEDFASTFAKHSSAAA